jgi:hypothetical protein
MYPGHELLVDDPTGGFVRSHGPSIPGTNAQRLAYPTSILSVGRQWYETDTGYTYQWSGSAWGLVFTAVPINSITNAYLAQAPAYTMKGNPTPLISNLQDMSLAQISSFLNIPNVWAGGVELGASGISVTGTYSNFVATITHNSHGYNVGDIVVIAGTLLNSQLWVITQTTTNTYSFNFLNAGGSGTFTTPVEWFWFKGTRSSANFAQKVSAIVRNSTGNYSFTLTNAQPDIYYGINAVGVNSAGDAAFSFCQYAGVTAAGFNILVYTNAVNDALISFTISLTGIV